MKKPLEHLTSYLVLSGEAHRMTETLPCTDDIAECLLDEKSVSKTRCLLLSNDIVTHRIKLFYKCED